MKEARKLFLGEKWCAIGVLALGLAIGGFSCGTAAAQSADEEPTPMKLKLGPQIEATDVNGGKLFDAQIQLTKAAAGERKHAERAHAGKGNANEKAGSGNGVEFYPGDLIYHQGGAVLQSTVSHDIYVNCDASCFGHPGTFLTNLGKSQLIHVTDQYVGTSGGHRYTVGQGGMITYPVKKGTPLGPQDILTLLYTAASNFGTGYGNVYHIYFAPGIDVCRDATLTQCYSPDNPPTWFFCAFHSFVDFKDIGHTLFTVEPFQDVSGCAVQQPSPNGSLVDSTADVLSHELFETITDPDLDAWWNSYDLGLGGSEIGDECQNFNFGYSNINLAGTLYEIQPEYSNEQHACATRTPGD